MNKITAWIAAVGSNPKFITFMAHCWFAYAMLYTYPRVWMGLVLVALFAVKEFFFDKHYEANQHFYDNLFDFAGYVTGIVLAGFMLRLL